MIRLLKHSTSLLIRRNQLRFYQSVATSIVIPRSSTIIKKNEYEDNKRALKINQELGEVFTKIAVDGKLKQETARRVKQLQNFLGEEYHLKDELVVSTLNPWEENFVELSPKRSQEKIKLSTERMTVLGAKLYRLQTTLMVLNLRARGNTEQDHDEINELNFSRFEDRIHTLMKSNLSLMKYLRAAGFRELIFFSNRPAAKFRRVAEKNSLFMIIGLISFQHGESVAKRFINERVIYGHGGVFDFAKKIIMNK